jgi:hypothetical protein
MRVMLHFVLRFPSDPAVRFVILALPGGKHSFSCGWWRRLRGGLSRLDAHSRAEFWTGSAWQAAPRPLMEEWN